MKAKTLILTAILGMFLSGVALAAPGKAGYDEKANPDVDLQRAIEQAKRENKRILMEVGGEWCIWCHHLDKFLKSEAEVARLLDQKFVVLKVNYSRGNKNEAFLSRYPAVPGYPHLFVLENDGRVLHSQGTVDLELPKGSGKGYYDRAKWIEFLNKWAPPAAGKKAS